MKFRLDMQRIRAATLVHYIRLHAVVGRFITRLQLKERVDLSSLAAKVIGRGVTDIYEVSDDPDVIPRKAATDAVETVDGLDPFSIQKRLRENPKIEDGDYFAEIYTVPAYTIISYEALVTKPKADAAGAAEAHTRAYGKGLSDTARATETVNQKLGRGFSDAFEASDAPQVAPAKPIADAAGAAEVHTRAYGKGLSDTTGAAETINQKLVGKGLGDGTETSDALQATLAKPVSDGAQWVDGLVFKVGVNPSDGAKTSEQRAIQFGTQFLDSLEALESVSIWLRKPSVSSVGAEDELEVYDPNKELRPEDFLGVENYPQMMLSTERGESLDVAELVAVTPKLGILEEPTVSDGGSLRAQGYCSFDYFAQDYVGAARTF